MRIAPVLPVLVLDEIRGAQEMARTLVASGLCAIEVALRTPNSLAILREMAAVEGAIVGAGTVTDLRGLDAALEAGAGFVVSPGLTESLCKAVLDRGVAYLPGVATASDIMRGLDLGLNRFKFFPAEASGGIEALLALSGPFSEVRFCPTGGITIDNAKNWLALDCVLCVGGTWIVPRNHAGLAQIRHAADAAVKLKR